MLYPHTDTHPALLYGSGVKYVAISDLSDQRACAPGQHANNSERITRECGSSAAKQRHTRDYRQKQLTEKGMAGNQCTRRRFLVPRPTLMGGQ